MRQAVRVGLAAALCGAVQASFPELEVARNEATWKEFEKFMDTYNKKYADDYLKLQRYQVFKSNLAYITAENAKGNMYELGLNEWVDLTHEEFVGSNGYGVPSMSERWGGAKHLGTHEYNGEALPSSVDWSTKGAVTPIKNQGQCGSCWAFSTTGSLEGAWAIKNKNLVSLSEQQLVDCAGSFGNQGCNGGLMDNAFKYIEQANMCTEASYPYKAVGGQCAASNCTVGIAKGKLTGYKDVSKDNEQAMMSAVALGPVSVAIEADKQVFQMYKSGVLKAMCGAQLDHGVLVVGYGTLNGTDYWKVKNSWGATWGLNGYVLLQRGKGQSGECGLLSVPSYPVVSSSTEQSLVV